MGVKKVKTEIRQAQIIEAALRTISASGLKGFTISTVAKNVGVATGDIYRHFKNKNAILNAIVSDIEVNLKMMAREFCNRNDTANECLESIFFKHIDFIKRHKGILRIIFSDEMYSADKNVSIKLKNSVKEYRNDIRKVLMRGIKEGTFNANLDIDAAASAFVGLIQSIAIQWMLSGYSFSPKTRGKKIWKIYLKGILQ